MWEVTTVHSSARSGPPAGSDQTTRLLLIRSKGGELPWLAQTILREMAPVDLVQVVGFANAMWRLGSERFDSVLLDLEGADAAAIRYCRSQIATVAAVPVVNLRDQAEVAGARWPKAARPAPQRRPPPAAESQGKPTRLPWQRRPRRASGSDPQPAGR
jgi:hypothetical protein